MEFNPSLAEHNIPCLSKQCRSALFVIKYVNFYQKRGSSNLIGWKLEFRRGRGINLFSMTRVKKNIYLEMPLVTVLILTLKTPIKTAADNILKYLFFNFSKKTSLDISCESSAKQTIHMKYQDLFSLKN